MSVNVGDQIPDVEIKTMGPEGMPVGISTGAALGTRRVLAGN